MSWEAWGDPDEPQMKGCPDCDGTGVIEDGEDAEDCLRCDGSGEVEEVGYSSKFDEDVFDNAPEIPLSESEIVSIMAAVTQTYKPLEWVDCDNLKHNYAIDDSCGGFLFTVWESQESGWAWDVDKDAYSDDGQELLHREWNCLSGDDAKAKAEAWRQNRVTMQPTGHAHAT